MLMHFCVFFISIVASLNFSIVFFKNARPFSKQLEKGEGGILFVSFMSPNGPLGFGHDRDKGEKLRGMFWILHVGPSRVYLFRVLSSYSPWCFVF